MPDLISTIGSFLEYLKKEKGYSDHTIDAYAHDLGQFKEFVKNLKGALSLESIMRKNAYFDCLPIH